jgi:cold shock CspA family protein
MPKIGGRVFPKAPPGFSAITASRTKGTVVKWIPSQAWARKPDGYGFIKPDAEAHDVYLSSGDVVEGKIFEGARVEFARRRSKIVAGRGHAAAVKVVS